MIDRHRRQAEFARTVVVAGHRPGADKNWAKAFDSRPGSGWKASCSCGWAPKAYYHSQMEAWAACGRHLKTELNKLKKQPSLRMAEIIQEIERLARKMARDRGRPADAGEIGILLSTVELACEAARSDLMAVLADAWGLYIVEQDDMDEFLRVMTEMMPGAWWAGRAAAKAQS
jgi:hypothetical protein